VLAGLQEFDGFLPGDIGQVLQRSIGLFFEIGAAIQWNERVEDFLRHSGSDTHAEFADKPCAVSRRFQDRWIGLQSDLVGYRRSSEGVFMRAFPKSGK